ncbi:hypothetical protein [Desulfobulbus alkaliphilus]|uniref:hypothetical protein n=1 Tax=Desulfobulbus alkaliphilus TaxID=869814 RepID=UPI001965FA84|nr:hypothetical protein [Desulfobulbus alkaliphilus]MBM9536364.1 hypothetical protein [Desulfobulbus alkaliphilus]
MAAKQGRCFLQGKRQGWCLGVALVLVSILAGCSEKTATVQFKVNSQPEGSYVLYQMRGPQAPCGDEWIYLGMTPLRGVRQFDRQQLESSSKITLKVMHPGYLEQKVEWDGPGFYQEAQGKGGVFFAPIMIPAHSP